MNTLLLAAETSSQWRFVYIIAFLFGALILPFVIGRVIASWLRMREYGWRIGLILCALIVGCVILGRTWDPQNRRFAIPLGVDLQGGVILIYEVDQSVKVIDDTKPKDDGSLEEERAEGQYSMSALIEALSRRINPSGTKEIVVRPYGLGQVEIIIPEVDQRAVEQIKKVISTSGVLQFRIVANTRDHNDIIELAQEMAQDPIQKRGRIIRDDAGEAVGLWARVGREEIVRRGVRPFKVDVTPFTVRDASSGVILNIPAEVANNPADTDDDDRRLRLAEWVNEQGIQEIDVLMATNDGLDVTGAHLSSVMKSKDEFMNPDILFTLTTEGTPLFAELTGRNSPDGQFHRQLGIVLDNELLSAPNIQEQITQNGRITGRFTEEEVQFLVNILEAGSLPVVLNKNPISQNLISPLLGRETIEQGQWAMAGATVLVFVFMLVYYRFAGFLACLALVLNILLTLAIMVLIKAPLTMPGLAGLVLTVGMSVDANVLIFERMREELARGAALRMVIRNGFSRATATIVDANVTTILTAVILYAIGTDQLRGFAVTLILGILTSMFTAIFCTRVAFDIVERTRVMSSLKMFQFIGLTHLDFISKRYLAITASAVVIGIGLVGAIVRGEDLFDIDFTGGTSVHVNLQKPADSEDVRAIIGKEFEARNVPFTLTGMSTAPGQNETTRFKIDAKIREVEELEQIIREAFRKASGDIKLATYSLTYGSMRTTEPTRPAPKPTAQNTPERPADPSDSTISSAPAAEVKSGEDAKENDPRPQPPSSVKDLDKDKGNLEDNQGAAFALPSNSLLALATQESDQSAAENDSPPENPQPEESKPEDAPPADESKEPADAPAPAAPDAPTDQPADAPPNPLSDAPADQPADAPARQPADAPVDEPAKGADEAPADAPQSSARDQAPADAKAAPPSESRPTGPSEGPGATSGNRSAPLTSLVEVELTFAHDINEPTLRAEIEDTARELNIPLSYFDLHNPGWQPGSSNAFKSWTLRIPATQEETQQLLERLQVRFGDTPVWSSSNKIGPQVAGRMQRTAIAALVASWLGIIVYVWIRFQNLVFGLAAVVALIHDVLVTVAALALSHWLAGALGFLLVEDFKISLTIVAALLTIIGYSINDTIVIFDRLREVRGKSPEITADMINLSLNQTLSRTLLTAFTVFLVVIVLYGFGGQGIHGFAFAMLIGVISGTYSTIYIASPFVLWLAGRSAKARPKSAAA